MAKQQITTYSDDFGGQGDAEPHRFSYEGQVYEVDLNKQHSKAFKNTIKKYIEVARPIGSAETSSINYSEVRKWARENNISVPDRGLIAGEVIRQFTLAQV